MKLTTSVAASATLLSTALAAPIAPLIDNPTEGWVNGALATWTITKFFVTNNTDNLSSTFAFYIEDNNNNTQPCSISLAYPTGTSLNLGCSSSYGDFTTGSTSPYSLSWIYEPNTDQAILEVYSNNTAAAFLYPKASHMLVGNLAINDNGPNAVQLLPDGVADVWPTSAAANAPAPTSTEASSGVVASGVSQIVSGVGEVASGVSAAASSVVADASSIVASMTFAAMSTTSTGMSTAPTATGSDG